MSRGAPSRQNFPEGQGLPILPVLLPESSLLSLSPFRYVLYCDPKVGASLVAQRGKNPPAMQETWVRSLGREDPLEKGMATPSSVLAWKIPTERGAWQAPVHGAARVGDD